MSASVVNLQQPDPAIDLWDAFWTLYPRHEAKKDAVRVWSRMKESDRHAAVLAIADWRQVWRAQGRDTHLIPLPATWLNGERWEDEVPKGLIPKGVATRGPAGTAQVDTGYLHGHHAERPSPPPLPEHVLSMLAKAKEKLK